MKDENQTELPRPESRENKTCANESETEKKLTPEEQMELYEKSLKEDDCGHQPC